MSLALERDIPYVCRPDVEDVAHALARAGDQLLRVAVPQQQRAQSQRRQRSEPLIRRGERSKSNVRKYHSVRKSKDQLDISIGVS